MPPYHNVPPLTRCLHITMNVPPFTKSLSSHNVAAFCEERFAMSISNHVLYHCGGTSIIIEAMRCCSFINYEFVLKYGLKRSKLWSLITISVWRYTLVAMYRCIITFRPFLKTAGGIVLGSVAVSAVSADVLPYISVAIKASFLKLGMCNICKNNIAKMFLDF